MSIQLEALADEVFGAAGAQARLGSQALREPFGEVVWNPSYPDLFFLNGIADLVAPQWSAAQFEATVRKLLPGIRHLRVSSRNPATVATLGAALTAAGYQHEVRLAMIEAFPSTPAGEGQAAGYRLRPVDDELAWSSFEELIPLDAREHGFSTAMMRQCIELCRWRAANTAHHYYLLEDAGRPLAHVGLFQHGPLVYLHGLYTRPDCRRRGVGNALMRAMSNEVRRIGGERLSLQCADDGYLPGYYARRGYRPVGEQHLWSKST